METNETMEMNATSRKDLYYIDPRSIVVTEGWNSRVLFEGIEELAKSIREHGMLNPITVQSVKVDGEERFRLIDGERRYRAVMMLLEEGVDVSRVPALKLSLSLSEEELLIQQFQRNEGRNFTEYEMGIFARKMMDRCGKTMSEVAEIMGKNAGQITYAVQLLEMDPRVQELLKYDRISGSNVRRIYQCHPNDEEGAVEEIMGLQRKAEEKAKASGEPARITLKDLDVKGRTILSKDSKQILKGMKLLYKYFGESGAKSFKPRAVIAELEKGRLINDVFAEIAESEREQVAKAE